MPLPSMLQGDSLTRLLQGAAVGAIATMFIGFGWGGWSLESTAAKRVDDATRTTLVTALAPICVDKFQQTVGSAGKLVELKKVASYQQGTFIENGGWATMPGNDKANSAVAQACANLLDKLK
jgi:hypothetical protein